VSESFIVEEELGSTRSTLTAYSRSYLLSMATMTAGVTVTAYCLWAFEQSARTDFPWFELTIIPFVLAVLRYGLLIDAGTASAPEDVFLSDRAMQILSLSWAATFALAIHFGG
jgi:decaprenyl-phosphate phosphoribosyltransferase